MVEQEHPKPPPAPKNSAQRKISAVIAGPAGYLEREIHMYSAFPAGEACVLRDPLELHKSNGVWVPA